MCGHGLSCHECRFPAAMEVFWPAWAGRYCRLHGESLIAQSEVFGVGPIKVIYLEETCSTS
jgi:hypothetical protein